MSGVNYSLGAGKPLISREQNYVLDRKLLTIHSEDRDITKWPNANEFEIVLPQQLLNIQSMRLVEIEVPSKLYVFSNLYQNTIIDLSSFRNKNFSFGCIYSFILGIGLYGSVYLLPLFLFTIAGYNTLQIGITMIVTGVFQFVSAPVAGKMFGSGIDKRIILAIGFSLFA